MSEIKFEIDGLYLIKNFIFEDERGVFTKTYNLEKVKEYDININIKEIYYSISEKNVIRGMHFQVPPYEHDKLIYLTSGKILDLVLDIRKKSKTYGHYVSIELNANNDTLFIPKGCAHGFLSLKDKTTVVYNQSSVYSKEHDKGILWNSFGFEWGIQNPIISQRDLELPKFSEISNMF